MPRLGVPGVTWQFQGAQEWIAGPKMPDPPERKFSRCHTCYLGVKEAFDGPPFPFHRVTPFCFLGEAGFTGMGRC